MKFTEWLKEKGFSSKVTRDYESRLKRALRLLEAETVCDTSLKELDDVPEFQNLSMSVKSQLRHSIRLYLQYTKNE